MKLSIKPELLKLLILSSGILGLLLHIVLYATGVDEKGLLITGYWAGTALWILTILVAAALIFLTRSIQGPTEYRDAYPVSFFGGLGAVALAAAIGLTTLEELSAESGLHILNGVLGFGAAASLVYIGICRLMGKKPAFGYHAVVCGCFAMRMVSQYQYWSSDPQLMDYAFYLSAYVALMLTAYQQAAFDADMGNHRALWSLSLAAVYLCCLSLRGPADTWLMLTAGIWAFTNLTSLTVRPKRQRPALNLEDEPQEEV